jgi:hypothetical protein
LKLLVLLSLLLAILATAVLSGYRRSPDASLTGRAESLSVASDQRAEASTSEPPRGLRALSPVEEAIVREPFAPKAARRRLATVVVRAKERPPLKKRDGMGWAQPDPVYWQRIPPAARAIPRDWSPLPVVYFTNTEVGGRREVRLREGPEYDQWLLRDPLHHLTACISVHRATRRVYFMEVARQPDGDWDLRVSADKCYSCHASGPRVIRPLDEPQVDRQTLAAFNRRILSYGACDFGDSVPEEQQFRSMDDAGCAGCHDGTRRGRLYSVHRPMILFKLDREETMPVTREDKVARLQGGSFGVR